MEQADGSVIISTKMDTSTIDKSFERLKTDAQALGVTCEKAGDKIKMAFGNQDIVEPTAKAIEKIQKSLDDITYNIYDPSREVEYYTQKTVPLGQGYQYDEAEILKQIDAYNAEIDASTMAAQSAQIQAERKARAEEVAAERAARAAEKASAEEIKAQERATRAAEKEASKKKRAQEKAYKQATKGARRFATRFSRILSGALIFNALSSGLRQLTSYFGTALKKNSEFSQSFAQLKGAFLTAVQPIYEAVVPALIYLVNVLTRAMQAVSRFMSLLTGKSAAQMAENAKNLYDQAKATEAAGNAAEDAKNQIMGFDEINRLEDTSSSSSGTSGSAGGIAANFEQAEIPEMDLDKLITYSSGVLLALGVILTFSGANIPLGLGLMAIGAVGLATEIAANWDSMGTEVEKAIDIVLGTLAVGGLVIGAILAFTGANIPLGIGLMALGATALGTEIALNWSAVKDYLENSWGEILSFLSAASFGIGAILAFSGANLPLGIALMAAGAVGLVTSIALNWDTVKEKLHGAAGAVTAALGAAMLAVGAVLAFSGANLPLGIALLAVGATQLIGTAAINWDTIEDALQGPIGAVVAGVSAALLALGAILAFSGANIPLGIALMAGGAAGLVTVTALNWNAILDKIKSVWGSITNWFNSSVRPKLTLSYWQDKFSVIGNALVSVGKNAANGAIGLINSMLQTVTNGVNSLFQLLSFNIDIPGIGSLGVSLPQFSAPQIPYLAQGAVLPANKPFLAMVGDQKNGTNVEAPLETIKQAVAEVLAKNGATGQIDVNVTFEGDEGQLIRYLTPKITVQQRRNNRALGV